MDYLNVFGFINIPFLALTAFLLISFMAAASMLTPPNSAHPHTVDQDDDQIGEPVHAFRSGANMAVFGMIGLVIAAFVIAARFI